MKILVTGTEGYIGSLLAPVDGTRTRSQIQHSTKLVGYTTVLS